MVQRHVPRLGTQLAVVYAFVRIVLAGRHPFFRTDLRAEELQSRGLTLDARRLSFASPLEICGIASWAAHVVKDGRTVRVLLPEDRDVANYLLRMNLSLMLADSVQISGDLTEGERLDRSDVLLELTRIDQPHEADELAERIAPLARRHSDARVTSAVFMGLGELLDNACSHAGSPVGVYAAAQAYTGETSGRRGLEIAVADGGMGILQHLRGNPRYRRFRSSATAIRWALRPGVTGTGDRRGYGFSDIVEEVGRAGLGRLLVRSVDGVGRVTVHRRRSRGEFETSSVAVPGTWIWLRVRVP